MTKILVIGNGGREHALVKSLLKSSSVSEVHVAPGSEGMAREAICHPSQSLDPQSLGAFCRAKQIDLVVVGPEGPLVDGLASQLRELGLSVFGPSGQAARLEGSKVFSKEFMLKYQIPTARAVRVDSVWSTLEHAQEFSPPYVLKADGLAAGKGVFICQDLVELKSSAELLFEHKRLGDAGKEALLEEFLPGPESSVFVLINETGYKILPSARDHKRLLNGNQGPNTGGMGAMAPVSVSADDLANIEDQIVKRTFEGLKAEHMDYRGVLFLGLLKTAKGIHVLEYNVRFGDPETQSVLPLLDGDWAQVFLSVANNGNLPELRWKNLCVANVVLASPGYPDQPEKGVPIVGDVFAETPMSYFLHCGLKRNPEKSSWVTDGGRVLNAVGMGSDFKTALDRAYAQAAKVQWRGLQKRTDIGAV